MRAGVETGQVAEQRLQVGSRPRLRVLAEASVSRGQTVTPETQGLTLTLRQLSVFV